MMQNRLSIIQTINLKQSLNKLIILMKKILLIYVSLCLCIGIFAQSKLSPYTKKYLSLRKTECTQALQVKATEEYVPAYIYLNEGAKVSALEELGVKVNLNIKDILSVQLPAGHIEDVAALKEVKYIQVGTPVHPMMDKARPSAGVDKVQNGVDLPTLFCGKDVVIGVVDAGFQYSHLNFYDRNREKLRIKRVWEQNYTKGTPPEGFTYGGEFKSTEEILKVAGDVTSNSHGTHVAGIAAGADSLDGNAYYGVAGDADIVLVSMGETTPNNVNLSDAIAYIYKYAESVNKPCVINLSLGTQAGPHDGTSTFDLVTDELQGKGRLLVGSVGNFGNDKFHAAKTFISSSDEPMKTLIKYKKSPSTSNIGGDFEVWGEPGMKFALEIFVYNTFSDTQVDSTERIELGVEEGSTYEYEFKKNATGSVLITTEISPLNNKPHALVSLKLTGIKLNNKIGFNIIPKSTGTVHTWADDTYIELTSDDMEGWTDGDNNYSLAEIGGTGKNIISVGAYVTRNTYKKEGLDTEYTLNETMNDIATFSSRGPAIDGRTKPEITAPGTYIASSISSYDVTILSQNIAKSETWNGNTYYYAFMQGTSMAAPFVTGVLATWLQANPNLSPSDVREILKKTALTDEYTNILPTEGNGTWGYGKIDAWKGIKESLVWSSAVDAIPESLPEMVLLGKSADDYRILFVKANANVVISAYSMDGYQISRQKVGNVNVSEEIPVDLNNVPTGLYIVKVKGDRVNKSFKVFVQK